MKRFFFLFSTFTIFIFLWRFFVPAHEESEGNLLIEFQIVLEVVTLVALIGLFLQLRSRDHGGSKFTLAVTFWIAFVAGLGILAMRFSTAHGWYTGHRIYHPGYGSLRIAPQRGHDSAGFIDIAET